MAFASCKKEAKVEEPTITDSSEVVQQEEMMEEKPINPFVVKETSSDQISAIIAPKNNDTLYVTNFFATWCGPCMREIPHFKNKMAELKDKPVKFTFINIFETPKWNTDVKFFAETQDLGKNILLMDHEKMNPDFFSKNFKTWDGQSIPFTMLRKGNQTDEYGGMMTGEVLDAKIKSFIQ